MKGLKKLTENTSIPQQSPTNPLTKWTFMLQRDVCHKTWHAIFIIKMITQTCVEICQLEGDLCVGSEEILDGRTFISFKERI